MPSAQHRRGADGTNCSSRRNGGLAARQASDQINVTKDFAGDDCGGTTMSHISALGYLVVRGPLGPWRHFGTGVLGAQLIESPGSGRIRFRTDDRAWRIEVQDGAPGPDALVALGFEVADEPALDSLATELRAAAVPVKEDRELAAPRRVRRLLTFHDLEGNAIE